MRSFLLASFALLTLVVVGCDPAETPKTPPTEPKVETPKDKMEPKTEAPKDKMEPKTETPPPTETKPEPPKTETPK